jgi:hypothetical protein
MAYITSDPILAAHYNTFVSGNGTFGIVNDSVDNINTIWGTGTVDKGYGQSTILGEVAVGATTVTATQWATLLTRLNSIASHQGTALGGMVTPLVSNPISVITALSANITLVNTNRLTAAAIGTNVAYTASDASGWAASSVHTLGIEFTSGDAARYFFNAGGYIDLTCARVGAAGDSKDSDWDTHLTEVGTIRVAAHSTTQVIGTITGSQTIASATGYYELGIAPIQIFRQKFASGVYAGLGETVIALVTNGAQGSNGDTGDILSFGCAFLDPDAGPSDPISGDMQFTATVNYPSTTYLTEASWGAATNPFNTVVQT